MRASFHLSRCYGPVATLVSKLSRRMSLLSGADIRQSDLKARLGPKGELTRRISSDRVARRATCCAHHTRREGAKNSSIVVHAKSSIGEA